MVLFWARAARRTCAFAGAALYDVRRAVRRVRAARTARCAPCRRRLSAPKTWLNRCLRVLFRSARRNASPRKSRPRTRRDRVRWPLDSTTAMQGQSICEAGAALPPCSKPRWPPGVTARASTRRCPLLDARATAPSGGLFSEVKAHSLLPLQGCPRRGLSSKLEAHALTSRRHTLPRGLLPPWWRPPRSSTSGIGSRPTSIY